MENTIFTTLTPTEMRYLVAEAVEHTMKSMQKNSPAATKADAPHYVTKQEAARLISVCPSTIDNAARAKKLKRHYVGKSVRFLRSEVLALAQ